MIMKRIMLLLSLFISLTLLAGCNLQIRWHQSASTVFAHSVFAEIRDKNFGILTEKNINADNADLFQRLMSDISGNYYRKDFFTAIENRGYYNDLLLTLTIYHEDDYSGFYFEDWSGAGGDGTEPVTSVRATFENDQYLIYLNDLSENMILLVEDDTVVEISTPYGIYQRYDLSIDDYINQHLLVGTYANAAGETYQFTEDRQAIWPDRTFQYNLLDLSYLNVWYEHNAIYKLDAAGESASDEFYSYEIVGDELYLYQDRNSERDGDYTVDELIAVLTKIE